DELDRMPNVPLLEWSAEREIAQLSPELAAHAQLASLLGDEFSLEEFTGVLREIEADGFGSYFPLDSQVSLERLVETGLLVVHTHRRCGFRNTLLRDHIAHSVQHELQRAIHQAACRFYEHRFEATDHERLPRLAHHTARAELKDRAAALYLELAERT